MKLNMEQGGQQTNRLRFFADAVLWRGERLGVECQDRMMLKDIVPDPGDRCLELGRLTVLDECARAVDARIDFDSCGNARAVGRLELPLEAELTDESGNTYFAKATACCPVSIEAEGVTREDCGEVMLHCVARELNVQAASLECVNYLLKLDLHAYLTRRTLIELAQEEDEADQPAVGPVLVRESGFTRMPSPSAPSTAVQAPTGARGGYSLDSLAAGAARSCGRSDARATADSQAQSAQVQQSQRTADETASAQADEDDDDAYRTVVKMPVRRRRR